MITNKEIYGLHTSVDPDPSELYEAYRDVPLDSLDESRKTIPRCIPPAILQT